MTSLLKACVFFSAGLLMMVYPTLALLNETVRLPGFRPSYNNEYVCTSKKLNNEITYNMRGFSPADANGAAHHILLYGCEKPALEDEVWLCGEMSKSSPQQKSVNLNSGGVCDYMG